VEKAIKEKRDKKATRDDDVPGDVLKLLGEDGLRLMTQLINSIYVTGEWPKDLTGGTIIALKEKHVYFLFFYQIQINFLEIRS
jgi:hypothetical protein